VEDGLGPSDHTSFSARGVPALLFFTGVHDEYHTPDDDWVDPAGIARVAQLAWRVAWSLANAPGRPPAEPATAQPQHAGGPGYGVYLGTIPAFGGEPVRGVRLQGVRQGSPAEKAGLRRGDVIVSFDGAEVANLEEFAAVLFRAAPGSRVEIVVERDGARVPLQATLGERR
jgi:membrane-associated protease RseP (regulator of RpoE activity)